MSTYRFPDIPRTVAKTLEGLAAAGRVGTRTPASLTGLLPFVRVTRDGGYSDRVSDYARISVDVLDTDLIRGEALAEAIRQDLTDGPRRLDAAVLDRITCDNAPQEVAPWAPGINRYTAQYTVVSRRHRTA